ncbi:hypothetical protein ABH994_002479 [Bradyrhizobium yuanmingense]
MSVYDQTMGANFNRGKEVLCGAAARSLIGSA